MENVMDSFYKGDFKSFKDSIESELYKRVGEKIETIKSEIAKDLFKEEAESEADDDKEYEDISGEYLFDLSFPDGQPGTDLKDFRVYGTNKASAIKNLNQMFGKGKYVINSVKLYDFSDPLNDSGKGKTGQPVKESTINEGLKLIHTHTNGDRTAKVYRDSEYDEHRVKYFTNGEHHKDADSHHDFMRYDKEDKKNSLEDAHRGAKNWVNEKRKGLEESMDGIYNKSNKIKTDRLLKWDYSKGEDKPQLSIVDVKRRKNQKPFPNKYVADKTLEKSRKHDDLEESMDGIEVSSKTLKGFIEKRLNEIEK
jgi:hypothetical protein